MIIRSLLIVLLAFAALGLHSQTLSSHVVSTAGASYSNSSGSLSITMGEAVQGHYSNSTQSLSVGFQQAYPALIKQLLLTLFLQGLYDGPDMHKAQNSTGDQYAGTVADRIDVVLRQSASPYSTVTTINNVELNANGSVQCTIPGNLGANYYVAVQHRNHLETWSAVPVSFAGGTISYNFTDAASRAFGSNQKALGVGVWGFYAGDADHDGDVDGDDMIGISSGASVFLRGYEIADINGDGVVDALDLIQADNNAAVAVSVKRP